MDRQLQKKPWWRQRSAIAMLPVGLALLCLFGWVIFNRGSGLSVDLRSVSLARVSRGDFQEYIPVFGNAEPRQNWFLATPAGGTVKRILRKSGDLVKTGDLIVELTNPHLELDVMQRETVMNEQLGMLNNYQLQMDQLRSTLNGVLIAQTHKADLLGADVKRQEELARRHLVSVRDLETVHAQLAESQELAQMYRGQLHDQEVLRKSTLVDVDISRQSLRKNLVALSDILKGLEITATADGMLDMPTLELGQSVPAEFKLGRIYPVNDFKIVAKVDEIYSSRISASQTGSAEIDGVSHPVVVRKVYPTVEDGKFQLDMDFVGDEPHDIRAGQRLDLRIELDRSTTVLRLPVGAFYSDSGGKWVYVIDQKTHEAARQAVRLGRKNPEYYEVVDGLHEGMQVIISSYAAFGSAKRITLQ